jgi:cytochrome oxidase assembly protein ShyY1
MPAGYSFRPRLWALAVAAAACAAGIALGVWQAGRAEEKRKDEARAERISVRGEFLAERTVLLDNKLRRAR